MSESKGWFSVTCPSCKDSIYGPLAFSYDETDGGCSLLVFTCPKCSYQRHFVGEMNKGWRLLEGTKAQGRYK